MKCIYAALFLTLAVVFLTACGNSDEKQITFVEKEINLDIDSGHNVGLIFKGLDEKELKYHTSDESVASFVADGLLVGHSEGVCDVYVTASDVVSNIIPVTVCDFVAEADKLKEEIDKYYGTGNEKEAMNRYFMDRYSELPYYAAKRVDNFYVVEIYMQCGNAAKRVYTSERGEVYHLGECRSVTEKFKIIPEMLAMYEGKEACKICKP